MARNLCLTKANIENYDGVLFLDDDCLIPPDYFRLLLERINDFDVITGPNLNPAKTPPNAFQSKVSRFLGSSLAVGPFWGRFDVAPSGEKSTNSFFMLCNLFVSTKVLSEVQFSDRMFSGEENDFLTRARKRGFRTFYDARLRVDHLRRSNLKDFFLQNAKYGLGRAEQTFAQNLTLFFLMVGATWGLPLLVGIWAFEVLLAALALYALTDLALTLWLLRGTSFQIKDLLILPSLQIGYLWGIAQSPFLISQYRPTTHDLGQRHPLENT